MFRLAVVCFLSALCCAQEPISGWVAIPVAEYQSLRGRAFPAEKPPETPIEATLTKAEYDLKVENGVATGLATLTIDVLKDGLVAVPIPQGLLVREARLDGRVVALTPVKPGQLSAVLNRKGRSVMTLDVAFPVQVSGGEERLVLPSGSSGVTRVTLARAATADVEMRIDGGFLTAHSGAHWQAHARGTAPMQFSWRRKIEERRVELPLRMRGSLVQLFGLGDDASSLNAEVQIDVQQGSAAQVRLAVPASVTINQVPGATVADWEVKNSELVVNFLESVERSAAFTISGETRLPREGQVNLPLLRLLNSERDSGGVAVEVLGAGELKEVRPQGLESADPAELGALVSSRPSPSLSAFRLRPGNAARSLEVQVARYAQQAVLTANIDEARYRVLAAVDGKLLIQARYAVRNNQRSFLKVVLPADAAVWSSAVAGRPVRAGLGPDGSLLFPLSKGRAGEDAPAFAVEFVYLTRAAVWAPKGRASITLPAADLPISRAGLSLYYPPGYRLAPDVGAFRVQEFEPATATALNAQPPAPLPAAAAPPSIVPAKSAASGSTQALVDSYRNSTGARRTSLTLPTGLSFPALGPSLFLVSELNGEGKAATIPFEYQQVKGGAR